MQGNWRGLQEAAISLSSKMSDADIKNTETRVSLDFAEECRHISNEKYNKLRNKSEEVGRMLNHILEKPGKYRPRP